MTHKLTLEFNLMVEIGDKNIEDIKKMVAESYSGYCGESVIITKAEEIK